MTNQQFEEAKNLKNMISQCDNLIWLLQSGTQNTETYIAAINKNLSIPEDITWHCTNDFAKDLIDRLIAMITQTKEQVEERFEDL